MCGRIALGMNKDTVRCACSYRRTGSNSETSYVKPEWLDEHNGGKEYVPSYNIAPTQVTPVLVSRSRFQTNSNVQERILKPMMWGIIPPWHKGDYNNHNLSTNNCRLEGVKGSKLYGPAFQNGARCVAVVEGFYEWQTTQKTSKRQPYFIYSPQQEGLQIDNKETWSNSFTETQGWNGVRLLHLAALYSVWKASETVIYCYSILTQESNTTMDWLHHRMPVVLESDHQIQAWLDVDNVNPDMALSYLQPVKLLSWHPVSSLVNNSRNKQDDLHKRIILKKNYNSQKLLTTWFTKAEKRKNTAELENKNKKCKTANP